MNPAGQVVALKRNANFFTRQSGLADSLEKTRGLVSLAPDQLLHPENDTEYIVRLGKLRVSQFLADGREVARAVLQAGSVLTVRPPRPHGDNPGSDVYNLADIVLMALGEAELWSIPLGGLDSDH